MKKEKKSKDGRTSDNQEEGKSFSRTITVDEGEWSLSTLLKAFAENVKTGREIDKISKYTPEGLSQRIIEVANLVGGKKKLAQIINVSEAQLYRYLNQTNTPTIDTVVKIAEAGQVRLEWLIASQGDMKSSNDDYLLNIGEHLKALENYGWPIGRISKESSIPANELVAYAIGKKIPSLDVLARIAENTPISLDYLLTGKYLHLKEAERIEDGDNYCQLHLFDPYDLYKKDQLFDYNAVIQPLLFNEKWIQQKFKCALGDIMLMHTTDNSMTPVINPGDLVLIDKRHEHRAASDGIYVLNFGEAFVIRRIRNWPDGRISISFDNYRNSQGSLEYLGRDGEPGTPQLSSIVGKVVWVGQVY